MMLERFVAQFITIPLISDANVTISTDHIVLVVPRNDQECLVATTTDQLTAKISHNQMADLLGSKTLGGAKSKR